MAFILLIVTVNGAVMHSPSRSILGGRGGAAESYRYRLGAVIRRLNLDVFLLWKEEQGATQTTLWC